MIRFAGVGCVFLCCVFGGNRYAAAFEKEYINVCRICDMLFDIKSYINGESMTFREIFRHLQENGVYTSFSFLMNEFDMNEPRNSVIDSYLKCPVFRNDEYNERLIRLIRMLGTSDKPTQLELIDGCLSYFEGQAEFLREQLTMKKRLYNSLGISAGALLSIILI